MSFCYLCFNFEYYLLISRYKGKNLVHSAYFLIVFPVLFSITSTFSLCVPLNKILASTAFLKKGFIEPKMPAPKKAGLGV